MHVTFTLTASELLAAGLVGGLLVSLAIAFMASAMHREISKRALAELRRNRSLD